ncbi:MAG: hypothetical protein IJE07_04515 [Clostridia bacterium]|nr:hypothetical protein [Clostridia bacterium]
MEKLSIEKSRRLAELVLSEQQRRALDEAPDEERRRLLRTLYARQKSALSYLDLITLDMGKPAVHRDDEEPEKWLLFLAHPLMDLLLMVAVLTFIVLEWELPTVAAAILAALHTLLRVTHPALRRKTRPVLPEVHEAYVEETEMTRFLQQQADGIRADAASIADRQAVTLVRERQDMGADAVELYCALCEAALDIPDRELLAYPLSVLKMTLTERGLEAVPYTPETASLFDVMPADCAGGMRWPAIREKGTGVVVKRGLCLRPAADIQH